MSKLIKANGRTGKIHTPGQVVRNFRAQRNSHKQPTKQLSTIVRETLEEFAPFFANEPEQKSFAEYITGLIIVNKKNVSCGNRKYI